MKNRRVFTLRKYRRHTGKGIPVLTYLNCSGVRISGHNKNIGDCEIRFVKMIFNPSQLEEYVNASGFGDVQAWWVCAKKVYHSKTTFYLYEVALELTKLEQAMHANFENQRILEMH